jgi:tRNA modification GTPase
MIAALASAPGAAARGIVRISGPDVRDVLDRLGICDSARREPRPPNTVPRRFQGALFLKDIGDAALPVDVMYWPTSRSYTGQPLAELHTVGSPPLLEAVLAELFRQGVRPARAGEFTLRAFLAGRLDLIEAEAVLGVIDAQDHQELETALKQLGGGLSGEIAAVRSDLLDLLAELEAGLDFVEEDIEFVERADLINRLTHALDAIGRLSRQAENRLQTTGRWRVVITGLPNAGKSCLFNALAREEAAIVSPIKGTTRDVLVANVDLEGVAVELIDTAGWEASPDDMMKQAEAKRLEHALAADVLLFCIAKDQTAEDAAWNREQLAELRAQGRSCLAIQTKDDLAMDPVSLADFASPLIRVSAITEQGLEELKHRIALALSQQSQGGRQLIGTTAARSRESLTAAEEALREALAAAQQSAGEEIIALELHQALDHLGRILGTVFTDDILDRIFSKFCIGK